MHIEHRIVIAASPATVFRIYQDVQNWHSWDPDTKQAILYGPFQVGSRGRITPPKGMTVPMLLTQVVPDSSFTVESKIPMFRILFEHELVPVGDATEVMHRVSLSGLLSYVIGPMLRKQLNAGLPITLSRLKALAERAV